MAETSDDHLLYESKGSARSLWNTYRIFSDRIELQFRVVFTTIVIAKEEFVRVDVYKPPVIRTVFWALKMDLADLFTHVEVERKSGWIKKLRFTPANPHEFKEAVIAWAEQ